MDDFGRGNFHHDNNPAFSEQAQSQLFTAPLVYLFAAIPLFGLGLIFLLHFPCQLNISFSKEGNNGDRR